MARFPEPPPPARLRALAPELLQLPADTRLWRVYFRGRDHGTLWNTFRVFGPTAARFDHHLPTVGGQAHTQSRGILYAADSGPICLAEVFQRNRTIDRAGGDPWLVGFQLEQPVSLLDLRGRWITRAGASMAIATGQRSRTRRWSQAIYEAYPPVQGLVYPSSMYGSEPAYGLYERAAQALAARPFFHRALNDPALLTVLRNAAFELGYRLI